MTPCSTRIFAGVAVIKNRMTWVSSQKRWTKEYRGKTYSVSCRQLEAPPTKEQSVHAANGWWEAKQRELELAEKANTHPRSAAIIEAMQANLSTPIHTCAQAQETLQQIVLRATTTGEHLPDWFHAAVLGQEKVDAIKSTMESMIGGKTEKVINSIETQVDKWLAFLQGQVEMKMMDVGRFASYSRHVNAFSQWAGRGEEITIITATKLEAYWAYLARLVSENRYAPTTAQTMFMTARQFINRLCEHGLIPVPGNIRSKRLKFTQQTKSVERFTIEEVRQVLDSATEKTKLYVLLMLNGGMYQNDIAELGKNEVDWEGGAITRPRSKTPSGPVVRCKLWPETFALLQKFKAKPNVSNGRGGFRCLLTDADKPLSIQWLEEGKMRRYDVIRTALNVTFAKVGWNKPPKLFRKTAASELASSDHRSMVDVFLCHTAKSIADKHYVALTPDALDGAIDYLRVRLLGK